MRSALMMLGLGAGFLLLGLFLRDKKPAYSSASLGFAVLFALLFVAVFFKLI